jgi:hypothetical protein
MTTVNDVSRGREIYNGVLTNYTVQYTRDILGIANYSLTRHNNRRHALLRLDFWSLYAVTNP